MIIDSNELRSALARTGETYNQTQFAKESGFQYAYGAGMFLQAKIVMDHLPAAGGTFLDIGTGKGIIPRLVSSLGVRAVSVDNKASGGLALESIREAGVEGHHCDITSEPLPLPDNSVDCVLFADVIEHLQNSPKLVLKEIKRVLKEGGVCVATTPNACRLSIRIKVAMGYSNWPHIDDYYDLPYHGGHHHEYTVQEFKHVFTRENFSIKQMLMIEEALLTNVSSFSQLQSRIRTGKAQEASSHPLISLAKVPMRVMTRLFPSLRSDMILVAVK